jgi:putative addiction module component (TIGR02574 family)
MLSTFEEILSAALSLSPDKRAMLVERLLASLDGPYQEHVETAWAEVAEIRMREIDEGKVKAIDGEIVMQKLRSRYKR